MAWVAVAGAAVGVAGNMMSDKGGGGGGGGQTASKEPWSDAAPWLRENLRLGQELQGRYAANPFSDMQKLAYGRQFGDSDYFRNMTGSMLGQLNGQRPFDRNNPNARPAPFQFPSLTSGVMGNGGGLGNANMGGLFSSGVLGAAPPAPAAVVAKAPALGDDEQRFQDWKSSWAAKGHGDVATYDKWLLTGAGSRDWGNAGPGSGGGDGGGY